MYIGGYITLGISIANKHYLVANKKYELKYYMAYNFEYKYLSILK